MTYVLNEGTLVLEGVTLGQVVELVVKMLINLSASTVLDEETAEDSQAAHPEDLAWHSSILGTLSLTEASVSLSPLSALPFHCMHCELIVRQFVVQRSVLGRGHASAW